MTYRRVIPRDLFNEGSLLKCYGRLYIVMEQLADCDATFSEEDVDSFEIVQRDDDGAIFINNLILLTPSNAYRLTRPLNSRQPWPLYAEPVDSRDFDPVAVFDDFGNITEAMRALLKRAP